MKCLICGNKNFRPYYYPPVRFNNREFRYFECEFCFSAQVDPMPAEEDYKKMYGTSDHSYLNLLLPEEKVNFNFKRSKYNHQKYQLDFFLKFDYPTKGKTLLDFGCGSGFYMHHAALKGVECTGVEFDRSFVDLLIEKTGLNILTLDEISGKTFDLIHLGHVLEHMENPEELLASLRKYAHPETIFIIDGPLEKNPCLTRFLIKSISLLKRKKFNTYAPQHLTFTNYNSQLRFFERAGLKQLHYEVQEQTFPLPEKFNLLKPVSALLFIISRISIMVSGLNPCWGNIFHFAGKLR